MNRGRCAESARPAPAALVPRANPAGARLALASLVGSSDRTIWLYAFGYFACYVPYAAMTKALSNGSMTGIEILPITAVTSCLGMFVFLFSKGWFKDASHRRIAGIDVAVPTRWTFLSGLCTASVVATTTLAYTFVGVSIVFMMLLMRGGLLIIAPLVDAASKRAVRTVSWVALGISLFAVWIGSSHRGAVHFTVLAGVNVVVYLLAYVVRLRFMSKLAKADDPALSRRYFVEEQMVATPALCVMLAVFAFAGRGPVAEALHRGFVVVRPLPTMLALFAIGLFSQGTGIFGGLILLDKRENSFCVPVNRASSVLAGAVSSLILALAFGAPMLGAREWVGAALIIVAISVLALPAAPRRVPA